MNPENLIFDQEALNELLDIVGKDEIIPILSLMEPTIKPKVDNLMQQLHRGNLDDFKMTSHALIGASFVYGFNALGNEARYTEQQAAKKAPVSVLKFSVDRLAALIDPSFDEINNWCKSHNIEIPNCV